MGSDELLIVAVVVALLFVLGRGLRRMGWLGNDKQRRVSSGAASFLGELDHMLNPQRPTVEDIRQAKEDDGDVEDDQGEPPDPPTC